MQIVQKTFMAKTSLTNKGCFISNDAKRSIIDLVSDRRKFNLKEYFSSYPLKVIEKERYITTDVYAPYIDIAREMFPNAKIVLDKFHIVQLMTSNMNIKRVNIMKTMKTNTHNYRVLKRYWKIILAKECLEI